MSSKLAQLAALSGTAMGGQVQQSAGLGRMADRVALQRSDLTQAVILEQIMKLGTETVYSPDHWAQVCVDRANSGLPLPWERGYHEREYLSLLTKHED